MSIDDKTEKTLGFHPIDCNGGISLHVSPGMGGTLEQSWIFSNLTIGSTVNSAMEQTLPG